MSVQPPDDKPQPLLAHFEELRKRLIITALALLPAFGLCFAFADEIFVFLLAPYQRALATGAAQLIYTAPHEFFFTQLKIAAFGGFILIFPLAAWQAYAFVAPGLYAGEKRAVWPFLFAAPLLFAAGAALVYYLVMPLVMEFFLSMEKTSASYRIDMLPRVSEYLSLIMSLMLGFGLCFQLPVVVTLLVRAGLVSVAALRRARKYVVVIVLLLAAFLTPPDVMSQILLALPTMLLYELSIIMAVFAAPRKP